MFHNKFRHKVKRKIARGDHTASTICDIRQTQGNVSYTTEKSLESNHVLKTEEIIDQKNDFKYGGSLSRSYIRRCKIVF